MSIEGVAVDHLSANEVLHIFFTPHAPSRALACCHSPAPRRAASLRACLRSAQVAGRSAMAPLGFYAFASLRLCNASRRRNHVLSIECVLYRMCSL
jgi:hypothetical protein